MSQKQSDLEEQYRSAMLAFLTAPNKEAALEHAYLIGREALAGGLGVLEVTQMHHNAVLLSVLGPSLTEQGLHLAALALEFLWQTLMPFEMVNRGYKEATQHLSQLNRTLEERVTERTKELDDALGKLQRVFEETVQAIALTLEIRDPYTAGHQRRVAQLASAIARDMGLPEHQIQGLSIGGVLHDIGKIAVPADILNKPGKISEHEFGIIKTHPQVGFDILKRIEFSWPVAQIAFQHHERVNGSGYPSGLVGEDILPEAKILAVADVVEAMASHRPYRPALGIDRALEEIEQNRGVLFDPEVAETCLRLFREQRFSFSV